MFCFRLEVSVLGRFGLNSQNCQFKLKSGTYTNSNLQNSLVNLLFLFSTGNTSFGQTSSNVNEIIRTVLNNLLFFLQKDFTHTQSTKSTKTQISE